MIQPAQTRPSPTLRSIFFPSVVDLPKLLESLGMFSVQL
ncbi:uncharacterized protein G2W53_041315 [Senna tora]|uniref:Uncharacterized protein n=1 Tax=Senna tora TaxID=362788 RepID=A0A834W2S4_9FABA|nr:uncharacterized protein G2W53_041315 [Senna tora]